MRAGILLAAIVAVAPLTTVAGEGPDPVTSYPAAFFASSQPETALDMVQRLPGFSLDTGAGVRGFGGAAGNVLIDGVRPPAKGDSLDQILQRIPAAAVERIELIRAGAPGVDMQGKTVLANVIRRKDITGLTTVTGSVTHAYDGRLSGKLQVETEKRIGDTDLHGSILIGRFLDDGAGEGTWRRMFSDGTNVVAHDVARGHENNYKLTGSVETKALGGTLKINASALIDPYNFTQADTLEPPPGGDFEHLFNRADTVELGVRYERPLGSKTTLETYVLQQLGRQKEIDQFTSDPYTAALTQDDVSNLFDLRKRTSESIARADVKHEASSKLSLQAGAEGDYNWLQARTSFIENGAVVLLPAADVSVAEKRGEAFVTATWRPKTSVSIEATLKGEASHIASSGQVVSARSLYFFKPRLVAAWSPGKNDQFRIRVEREIGQLNFDDFTAQTAGINTGTVVAGNPTLDPQQDWVYEAAWDHRFWGGGDITATVRHYQYQQILDRVGVVDPSSGEVYDAPGDIGKGTEDDAAFNLTLPTDKVGLAHGQLTGAAIFRRSRATDPTTGLPRPITDLHGADWEAHYAQGLPKLKSSWGFDILGQFGQTEYHFDEVDTAKAKTYVSLFAEYKPRNDLTLKVELLNATARHVERYRQYFDGPRNDSPLDFNDLRDQRIGRLVRLSFVKVFG